MRFSRRAGRLVAAIVAGVVGVAAIFWFVWFLVGQTLDVASKWAEVVAGLIAAVVFLATAVRRLAMPSVDTLAARAVDDPASPLPEFPRAEQVVFGVIPREARWFQPRPDEQEALERALADSNHVGLVALPAARGAGKTQLAAAYARQCAADRFDVVAWINAQTIPDDEQAETRDRLLGPVAELAQLGAQLGLDTAGGTPEQAAAATIRAISVRDGKRRLLVFDNVDDPDSIADFLPATGTTKVVITTNRQEVTAMAGVTPVRVDMFTPAQGRAFLTEATTLPYTDQTLALGEDLGWLPLGLAQAAAVIVLNHWSYQDYRRRLADVDVSRALVRLAGAQHPGVLAATTLSIQTLQRQDPSGDAHRLLAILSLLAPEGTSRAFLKDPQAVAALDMHDPRLDRALSALANASLVTQRLGSRTACLRRGARPGGHHDQTKIRSGNATGRQQRSTL